MSVTTIPNFSILNPNDQNRYFAENMAVNFESMKGSAAETLDETKE
jgi:hypothetical protein